MTTSLRIRIARLEARPQAARTEVLLYGWIDPLPDDHTGERHLVIVKREPTRSPNIEWCEFQERSGPAPAGRTDDAFVVGLTRE